MRASHDEQERAAGERSIGPGVPCLRDRDDERAVLDGLIEGARGGRGGVLVLRGEAGIGKTALLDHVIESAPGLRMLRAIGVESEAELAFAALHQLCGPLLGRLERLPGPQRNALQITFGLSAGPVPDRFFVGLAVLGLLSDAADERPLLCVIDDAQWLDRASAQALVFVARRLLAERVVMLFAARDPATELEDLPELTVEGLPARAARELLRSAIPGRLDARIVDQIVAETGGNPLALLELPRGLSRAQLATGFGWVGATSLSGQIEESFRQRLALLSEDTQGFLLLAASDPSGDRTLVFRAADRLGISGAALEPAESAGLIEIDGRLRFRHPLARSAVYRAATPDRRRRAHRALAEATDRQADPDRGAWHMAEATAGPDEDVAAELERAAGRAQERGGLAAAGAFLERAAALSPESSRRAQRALAGAQAEYEAGALDAALALLATADAGVGDDTQRAHAQLLRAQITFALQRGSDAPLLLLKAARDLEPVDPTLARATYLEALTAAMFAGRLARGGGVVEISEAALAGPPSPEPPSPSDLLLHGLAVRFTDGYAAGAPILKEALRAFHRVTVLPPEEARWLWFASWIALYLWDDDAWMELSTRHLNLVRETGALTALPFVLANRSSVYAFFGELSETAAYEEELRAATEATGIATVPYGSLSVAALRGREAELTELIRTTVSEAHGRGEGLVLTVTEFLTGVLYNGLGRYEGALAGIGQAERYYEEGPAIWALAELVEAAVRCGQPLLAGHAFERIGETTRPAGTDWALGTEALCHALLTDGDEAERLYLEAIERLGRTRVRMQVARAHLLYGEWLRRRRRRVDAREHLGTALEMFTSFRTEAFAARAERELLATGEQVRKRSVESRDELTAQETQVARLARDGLSNADIGDRLFISQHTVAYHLRKVFSKLEITSRGQLGRALPEGAGARLSS